jgi:hypothetical protein
MSGRYKFVSVLAGLGVILLATWIFWPRPTISPNTAKAPGLTNMPPAVPQTLAGISGSFNSTLAGLRNGLGVAALGELRNKLAVLETQQAVTAIRQFLTSWQDAATGLGFKPAANGRLSEAPTLRTFLLDYLGKIDPAAAAACARTILTERAASPDEWALALRNLALGDRSAEARALLEQKTLEVLRSEEWQQNPSAGYLESFDTAVYLGSTNLVPALAGLVRKQDNPAVAHAAYLALDRMVIANPAEMLSALGNDPDAMRGREGTRANFFARADVRDTRQRQILESYLLNDRIGAQELDTFSSLFPNANFMVSANLLTAVNTLTGPELTARDRASLDIARAWLADPRLARIQPQLQRTVRRLEDFVNQAAANR